jgi:hypothetical protein
MANIALAGPPPLPRWLRVAINVVIAVHLLAILGVVLHAASGPWPTPFGNPYIAGPQFAAPLEDAAAPYLRATRMTHTYRFRADQLGRPAFYFEVKLRDERGQTMKTLRFPDPKANVWVRYRQQLLADGLGDDRNLPPPQGEVVPSKKMPTQTIWEPEDKQMVLKTVEQHLLPRNRPVILSPTEWSLMLAKSYARSLCRTHGAASAEIVRHKREPILPPTMLPRNQAGEVQPPAELFEEMVASFGVHRRED